MKDILVEQNKNNQIIGIKGTKGNKECEFFAPLTIGAGGVNCPVSKTIITDIYNEPFIEKTHWSSAFRQYWKNVKSTS